MTGNANSPRPPLDGLRVLDLSRVISGPYLTMILSDLGAEVVKVEHPVGGDDSRQYGGKGDGKEAPVFVGLNRGKRSIAIDLRTGDGQDVARRLAARCDVLVENYRAGAMARMGLDYPALSAVNPGLVFCSISGYGSDGALAGLGGYDPIVQAETGLMYLTGDPACPPVRAGGSVIDSLTGLHAGMAILAALRERDRSGLGQFVDVALFDTAMASIGFILQGCLLTGEDPPRLGNMSFFTCPNGVYHCADGDLMMSAGNDRLFRKLVIEVLQQPQLAEDPRFATNADRLQHMDALTEALNATFSRAPREHWVQRLRDCGVPAGAVRRPSEAVASAETSERGMIQPMDHPTLGRVGTVGSPLHLSRSGTRPIAPSPLLGEHTIEVLRDVLGLGDDQIAALKASGAVSHAEPDRKL